MKILCYYPWIYLKSGIERTLIEYAKRTRHQIAFATNLFVPGDTFPEFSEFSVIELPSRVSVRRALVPVAEAVMKITLTRLKDFDHDVLLVHNDALANFILFRNHERPAVCFCHTPLRIAYDRYYISQYCKGKQSRRLLVSFLAQIHKWIDRKAWSHYDFIFFNSEEVRKRCIEGGLSVDNSSILHPGINRIMDSKSIVREPFFLYAGRIMWTKNVESAVLGFQKAKKQGYLPQPMRLVIAGMVDKKSLPYLSILKKIAGDDKSISFVESPSDAELRELYRRCFAVVFPPYNEDWGIVPLEAMSFGKVVISSDIGGPRESMIDGKTGWLVRPNPEGIAAGLRQCVAQENLLDDMSVACFNRAREFTWDKFALEMDEVLESVLEKSKATVKRKRPH